MRQESISELKAEFEGFPRLRLDFKSFRKLEWCVLV